MCVVALALDCHPRWRLVLAANRDEFHARETAPLARWNDAPQVIAGRDLQAGGSWLGVSNDGRLAVLTNIRTGTLPDPAKASRGALVADWLVAGVAPEDDALSGYNPCNLLLVGAEDAALYANHPVSSRTPLDRGLHSLSNGHASEPWPRRRAAEGALSLWLQSGDAPEALLAILRDESLLDDAGNSVFINAPVYGTRGSTVVAVADDGSGWICERRFNECGIQTGESAIAFNWR